jgi:glycine betaine/choline ABC-type transport system substrate-binding protein
MPSVLIYVVALSATNPLALSNTESVNIVIATNTFPESGVIAFELAVV